MPLRTAAVGLGITLDDILSQTSIDTIGGTNNGLPISFSYALNTTFSSSALTSFMSTSATYRYQLIAADAVGSITPTDTIRFLTTSGTQYSASVLNPVRNGNLLSTVGFSDTGLNYLASDELDALDFSGASTFGYLGDTSDVDPPPSPIGALGTGYPADTLTGVSFGGLVNAGTSTNLYVFTGSGGANNNITRLYQALDVTLSTAGVLTINGGGTQVPLPAAVWLLGSGLAGLGAIGRRRRQFALAKA
jgi:hypothetical protein